MMALLLLLAQGLQAAAAVAAAKPHILHVIVDE
jgi:hypothetical protein